MDTAAVYRPVRARPVRWPAGADPGQALGYLLARHVPLRLLPQALTDIQQAAGWSPDPLAAEAVGRGGARSWLAAAREHARSLGPPPGLQELVAVLADGRIRTRPAAREALAEAGASELADPVVLMDFARWCGMDQVPCASVRPGGRRSLDPSDRLYGTDHARLSAARRQAAAVLRRASVMEAGDLLCSLKEMGFAFDLAGRTEDLRQILGVDGDGAWLWPQVGQQTPLSRTMARIAGAGRAVSIDDVPSAVARCSTAYPRNRVPLTVAAVRAWLAASLAWTVTPDGYAEPVRALMPPDLPRRADQLVLEILGLDTAATWRELRTALQERGATESLAAFTMRYSPLLTRGPEGYQLIGRPS